MNSQEITIPEGCVLDFQGGSLNNGTILGNFDVKANLVKIYSNIYLKDFDKSINLEWFGVNDYTEDILENVINTHNNNKTFVLNTDLKINRQINLRDLFYVSIIGANKGTHYENKKSFVLLL